MNDLDLEIRDLAEDIASTNPAFAQATEAILTLHHSNPAANGLDTHTTRLAGEESLIALIALVLEAKADSKPVTDLPVTDRIATKAALLQLADGLTALATSGLTEDAAYHLHPAN